MLYLNEWLNTIKAIPLKRNHFIRSRESQYRQELVRFGRMLHQQGFVSACDGNLSVRLDENRIMVTPTGTSKCMMRKKDMVIVDTSGRKLQGDCNPTSEIAMHLTIYNLRSDIGAVVHAHPYTATAFACCGISLEDPLCSEVVLTLGSVPLAPYATPGTLEVSESLRPYIAGHQAILMANHGVVTLGNDLLQEYLNMEAVEHYTRIMAAAQQLGPRRFLDQFKIDKLLHMRRKYMEAAALSSHR